MTGTAGKVECFIPGRRGYAAAKESEVEVSLRAEGVMPERRVVKVDEQALKAGAHHGSTLYEHEGFRRAVLGEAPVEVTLNDGLRAVVIGLAAELSVREKRVVQIDGLSIL